ncbi:MAG: cytochrome c biogenesis protein CcdA [Micromonosporaceae bacterium]|nr:cytochrome c biogenesis protein CcdA [Micromonosporaceae bacterium]
MLPLAPAYLSYVTGLAGSDLDAALGVGPQGRPVSGPAPDRPGSDSLSSDGQGSDPLGAGAADGGLPERIGGAPTVLLTRRRARSRVLAGSALFVAGFTAVFLILSVTVSTLGRVLLEQQRAIEIGAGVIIILLGLGFLGLIGGMQREWRFQRLPRAGLASAPILGAVFALSWTPCVSPTLGVVLGLAAVEGSATRGAVLATAYSLGLGLPFLLFGLGFRRLLGVLATIRRHSQWVTRIGGVMLILLGLALVTGEWLDFINWLRATVGPGEVGI